MKRAFLVLGPESSGCRLVTRLLMAAGCAGDGGHLQRWDDRLPSDEPLLVWRRSVPHHHEWPRMDLMYVALVEKGYAVTAVVTTRRWSAMVASQISTFAHVPDVAIAERNIRRAYVAIFKDLAAVGAPFVVSSYEALVAPGGVEDLWRTLGLTGRAQPEALYDGNARWT